MLSLNHQLEAVADRSVQSRELLVPVSVRTDGCFPQHKYAILHPSAEDEAPGPSADSTQTLSSGLTLRCAREAEAGTERKPRSRRLVWWGKYKHLELNYGDTMGRQGSDQPCRC